MSPPSMRFGCYMWVWTRGVTGAYSQEIQALFGISGVLPNPNPGRLKKETSARLLLDEPLPEATRSAMLVVRVVDSGIGLSGIT